MGNRCDATGCTAEAKIKGWCVLHYKRFWRTGTTEPRQKRAPKVCSVEGCGEVARARGWCHPHWKKWKRHGDPTSPPPARPRRDVSTRFWEKVDKTTTPDGCWTWTASTVAKWGYGIFRVASGRTMERAHRVAWQLTYGPLEDGQQVLHHCDNPPCVRPDHLFTGSHDDNMADRNRKGRQSRLTTHSGESTPNHVLSSADVETIRHRYSTEDVFQRELAVEFGVSQTTIGKIVRGQHWNVDATVPRRTFRNRPKRHR